MCWREPSERAHTLLHSLNSRQKWRSGSRTSQEYQWLAGNDLREEGGRLAIECEQVDVSGALGLIDKALSDLVVFH